MAKTELTGKQIKDQSVDLAVDVDGILPVIRGGTGCDTVPLNNVILGNGTGAFQAVAPGSNGNVLTSNGTSWISQIPDTVQNSVISVAGRIGEVTLTVADVSGAQATSERGQANGYASLDSTGKVPLAQWADQVVDGGGATVTVLYTIDGGTA